MDRWWGVEGDPTKNGVKRYLRLPPITPVIILAY